MGKVRTTATMTMDSRNLDEVVGIFETFIRDVREKDPGTLSYEYYVDDGDQVTIYVFEEYADGRPTWPTSPTSTWRPSGRLLSS